MAIPLTQFQKKMAARRGTSSIDKLSRQYQEQIKNITGEYETSFADYTKKRTEAMAPYEAATAQHKKDYAAYETSVEAFKGRLSEFQKQVEAVKANPREKVSYYTQKSNVNPSFTDTVIPGVGVFGLNKGEMPSDYQWVNGTEIWRNKAVPKFTEKAPEAPKAPLAPEIPEFDAKPFEEKKALNEQTYKRELGERKSARMGAVSRKSTRPLLSGTAP